MDIVCGIVLVDILPPLRVTKTANNRIWKMGIGSDFRRSRTEDTNESTVQIPQVSRTEKQGENRKMIGKLH